MQLTGKYKARTPRHCAERQLQRNEHEKESCQVHALSRVRRCCCCPWPRPGGGRSATQPLRFFQTAGKQTNWSARKYMWGNHLKSNYQFFSHSLSQLNKHKEKKKLNEKNWFLSPLSPLANGGWLPTPPQSTQRLPSPPHKAGEGTCHIAKTQVISV